MTNRDPGSPLSVRTGFTAGSFQIWRTMAIWLLLGSPLPLAAQQQDLRILLDPGHGIRAGTAEGELMEGRICYAFAVILADSLRARGVVVGLSRDSADGGYESRLERARALNPTWTIGVHLEPEHLSQNSVAKVIGNLQDSRTRTLSERLAASMERTIGGRVEVMDLRVRLLAGVPGVVLKLGNRDDEGVVRRLLEPAYLGLIAGDLAGALAVAGGNQ